MTNASARWIVHEGVPYIRIKVPGNVIAILLPEVAQQLSFSIQRVMSTNPPDHDDNGAGDD